VQFEYVCLQVKIKAKDGCVYEFPSHQWLASNVGDGKTSRELVGKSHCPNIDAPPEGKSSFNHEQAILNEKGNVLGVAALNMCSQFKMIPQNNFGNSVDR